MKLSPIEFHSSVIGVTADDRLLIALTDDECACVAILLCSEEAGQTLCDAIMAALRNMRTDHE
jgi:hypothetical protein